MLPREVDPESERAQAFIETGLARLPEPEPPGEPLDRVALRALVDVWAERLGATVRRIQVRAMRRKWASLSSKGTLTLARGQPAQQWSQISGLADRLELHSPAPTFDGAHALPESSSGSESTGSRR